jgi:hypothetical protein
LARKRDYDTIKFLRPVATRRKPTFSISKICETKCLVRARSLACIMSERVGDKRRSFGFTNDPEADTHTVTIKTKSAICRSDSPCASSVKN